MTKLDECKELISGIRASYSERSSEVASRIDIATKKVNELTEIADGCRKDNASDIDAYLKANKQLTSARAELTELEEYLTRIEKEVPMSDADYQKWCEELKEFCHAEVTKHRDNIIKLLGEVVSESSKAIDTIRETDSLLNILQDDLHMSLDRSPLADGKPNLYSNTQKYRGIESMPVVNERCETMLCILKGQRIPQTDNKNWRTV